MKDPIVAVAPKAARSRRWLAAVLIATLTASAALALVDDESDGVVATTTRVRRASSDANVATNASGATRGARQARERAAGDVAAAPAWPEPPAKRNGEPASIDGVAWGTPEPVAVAEPPPVAPAPPPAPPERVAPAFPYVLIGRLDDGRSLALLSGPLRSLSVAAGDVVDGQWRVDTVSDDGITLTWLPGGQQQQLGFRAS